MEPFVSCTVRELPEHMQYAAALYACDVNPANRPRKVDSPQHLALLTAKYWGSEGVNLTVGFLEPISVSLREKILSHMNAWGQWGKVRFAWTRTSPQVRITRSGEGYWSYLGTDITSIPAGQPTMCLQDFSENTPDSEFFRVVRHETGHTLGFPHEQQRAEILKLLDQEKTIAYFMRTQGWSRQEVIEQVLVPLEERSIIGTDHADTKSVMTYFFPGSITKSGDPIPGGTDIDLNDQAFVAKVYPLTSVPPPPPPSSRLRIVLDVDVSGKTVSVVSVG